MNRLKSTTKIVKSILEKDEKARNSDSYLYLKVISHIAEHLGIKLHELSVPMFLMHGSEMGFVGFETVRRTRQKIQAAFPALAACDRVEGFRAENEREFREYARGGV